jgi:hypothetical protein
MGYFLGRGSFEIPHVAYTLSLLQALIHSGKWKLEYFAPSESEPQLRPEGAWHGDYLLWSDRGSNLVGWVVTS